MGIKDQTVEQFLATIADATATPGGGTASAVAGALGVALARMAAALARDKKGYEGVQADLVALETRAAVVQDRLLELAARDSQAFEAVMGAMRLPRGTDAEKASRVEAIQSAYRKATEVPLETMEACVDALELAAIAVEKGNRGATTDAAVAVLLAEAGMRGASLNVRVNLAAIKDEGFRTASETKLDRLLSHADAVGHRAMAMAEGRL